MKIPERTEQTWINIWYTIASPIYDLLIKMDEPFSARKNLITRLNIQENEKIIEIGIGTGRNIPHYPKTATIYGIDNNKSMLKKAKKKAKKQGFENITLEICDAKNLNFEGCTFDAGIMTYALAGIPNNQKALSELTRIIKPKGRIGILDFDYMSRSFIGGSTNIDLDGLIDNNSELEQIHHTRYRKQDLYILEKIILDSKK